MAKLAKQASAGSPMKKNGDDKNKKPMAGFLGPQSLKPNSKPSDFDPKDAMFGFVPTTNPKQTITKQKRNVRPVMPIKPKKIKKIDNK